MPPGEDAAPAAGAGAGPSEADAKGPAPHIRVETRKFKSFRLTDLQQHVGGSDRDADDLSKVLKELDHNGDGVINANELVGMLEGVVRSRRERRLMWFVIVALSIFAICTVGTIVGLTYAVVDSLKDTEVSGSVLMVKGSDTEVVRTGNSDFTTVNGVMVSLASLAAANTTAATTTAANTTVTPPADGVLRTASYLGTPVAFSSVVDVRSLMELKYLYLTGPSQVELALMVTGVARVPLDGSKHGTVVRIITTVGTITLDDTVVSFSADIADVFTEAGFKVSRNRRMLMGIYSVLGFFNFIADMEIFNLPSDQAAPKLPTGNYFMKLKIYEPCADPFSPAEDRCRLPLGADAPAFNYSYPPDAPAAAALAPPPSPAAAGRRASRMLKTQPHRSLAGSTEAFGFEDLAGVEIVDGARFMTHNETSSMFNGVQRTVTDLALVPAYRKIELMLPNGTTVAWTEATLPSDPSDPLPAYHCSTGTAPTEFLASKLNKSASKFEYLGVDYKYDRSARHFRLTVSQPAQNASSTPEALTVDYWDTLSNNYPLAIEFTHPFVGKIMMEVLDFHLMAAGSADADPSLFVAPAKSSCSKLDAVPHLTSAFAVPSAVFSDNTVVDPVVDMSASQRRMVIEESSARAAVWEGLDHVNGTGEWPQWALDMYGGVRPVQSDVRERSLASYIGTCGTLYYSMAFYFPPCKAEFGAWQFVMPMFKLMCNGTVAGGIKVAGGGYIDMCKMEIGGCIEVGIGLESYRSSTVISWIISRTGWKDIKIAEICVGYNPIKGEGFLTATIEIKAVVAKVELTAEMRFSSCCTWIVEAKVEAFLGYDVYFSSGWASIGEYKFVEDYYIKGNENLKNGVSNPTVSNLVGTYSVHDGWFGDWQGWQYCANVESPSSTALRGQQVTGFCIRLEGNQGGQDDTALNGIAISCQPGGFKRVTDGWYGEWKPWNSCPSGTYATGAQIRVESNQGGGDDTAANAVKLVCSNGAVIGRDEGFWGDWSAWRYCPSGTFLCGMNARLEAMQGGADDTAMNGLKIACCRF